METFRFQPGETPVLLSIPHMGTMIPADIAGTMTDTALAQPDVDRHLDRLYHFAPALGIGFLTSLCSRYVIDLNRDPEGNQQHPAADPTELCPLTTFDRSPVYKRGLEPDGAEIGRRVGAYWRPYHERLRDELRALRDRFGVAVLFDAHSVRSEVPRFFDGPLPDFNLGTGDGCSAAQPLVVRLMNVLSASERYSAALNGRLRGGYIIRSYGDPDDNIHAIQLELTQSVYMDEAAPYRFRPDLAAEVRPSLERLMSAVVEWSWEKATGRRRAAYL
ncbi:N-formylglutamate deformylase [Azospirillum picis]|uniref:N-formylglutamate amidohydrolase n=1 Tax=Azospirillum picis TaxID=488438 RepID=A0ABU0MGN2_9PROT|nr:N-formylglutamate deformylase [Azospirillum picis]MBP2298349.1 N-formylglutamate amidohydrolase [Azospirillum picis]MDQ0532602.1 N-formylglutamate amidohydrolase [Azospirillum picis]